MSMPRCSASAARIGLQSNLLLLVNIPLQRGVGHTPRATRTQAARRAASPTVHDDASIAAAAGRAPWRLTRVDGTVRARREELL
eukprot:6190644-Pyramimonas_sp.AAC.1